MPLAIWVHDPHPFLIRFSENLGIRYYGLAYVLGFVIATWLLYRYAHRGRSLLPAAKINDFMVAIVFGVMLGGRLGYFLLYEPQTLLHSPMTFFMVWKGGMASHGGFMGVILAVAWFSRAEKIPFLHLGDLIASTAPAGLLLGRIANFLNGELWGKSTLVDWAVKFTNETTPGGPIPRHPSQLYEAALEGGLLFAYMQCRIWRSDVVKQKPGRLAGEFLLGYALVRMFCEIFREPDEGISLIFGLSRGTFYSIFLVATGVWLIARKPRTP